MRRATTFRWVLIAAAVLTSPARAETFRDGRPAMGTVLEITVESDDSERARAALDACFELARTLEAIFTTWRTESELSALNRAAGSGPRDLSHELARILEEAVEWAERTEGAFDPTVGPLVTLWRAAGAEGRWPAPEQLAKARTAVGYRGIEMDGDEAELTRAGMTVDLGGFAKGWTLDRLGELLDDHDIENALLDFGQSSMLGIGKPSDAPAWRVLVRDPRGGHAGVVSLRDRSLSVSESFGESAQVEGRRLGHVIDPRTGMPLDRQTSAVVLAPSGAGAEAWSKALLVLAPEHALGMLEAAKDTEAMLLEPSGTRRVTPGFQEAVDLIPGSPRSDTARAPTPGSAKPGPPGP